jgi:hypothetical protein
MVCDAHPTGLISDIGAFLFVSDFDPRISCLTRRERDRAVLFSGRHRDGVRCTPYEIGGIQMSKSEIRNKLEGPKFQCSKSADGGPPNPFLISDIGAFLFVSDFDTRISCLMRRGRDRAVLFSGRHRDGVRCTPYEIGGIQMSKSEIRNKLEGPKFQCSKSADGGPPNPFLISDIGAFLFVSDFDTRISCLMRRGRDRAVLFSGRHRDGVRCTPYESIHT